jgi:hypothetical protein
VTVISAETSVELTNVDINTLAAEGTSLSITAAKNNIDLDNVTAYVSGALSATATAGDVLIDTATLSAGTTATLNGGSDAELTKVVLTAAAFASKAAADNWSATDSSFTIGSGGAAIEAGKQITLLATTDDVKNSVSLITGGTLSLTAGTGIALTNSGDNLLTVKAKTQSHTVTGNGDFTASKAAITTTGTGDNDTIKINTQGGGITITGSSFVSGRKIELDADGGNVTLTNNTVSAEGLFDVDASGNISVTDIDFTVGGNATLDAVNITIDNTDKTVTNRDIAITGSLSATASANLTLKNIYKLFAGATTLKATTDSDADILLSDIATVMINGALTAEAKSDLTIINGSSVDVSGTASLTATDGNILLDKIAETKINETLTATAGMDVTLNEVILLTVTNDANITAGNDITFVKGGINVEGKSANGIGNSLDLLAGNDISLGGAITVSDKNVKITATSGAIIDTNDTTSQNDNLTVANSDVVLTANAGIGSENMLEIQSAVSVDAKNTGTGNIVFDVISDTVIKNAATENGDVDIHSGGSLTVASNGVVNAGGTGNQIIIGAENDITLEKKLSLTADKSILLVASKGNLSARATTDSEAVKIVSDKIYLVAGKEITGDNVNYDNEIIGNKADDLGKFIGLLKGQVNVVAGTNVSVHNINNETFQLGNAISGDVMLLTTVNGDMGFDRVVAKVIDIQADNIGIKQLADGVHVNLGEFAQSEYNTANKTLLSTDVNVKIIGEIAVSVNKEGATLALDEQTISDDNIFAITVDNLVIDRITTGKNTGLKHTGFAESSNNSGIADTTIVKQIKSVDDFVVYKIASDSVLIHSDYIGGNLILLDGQFGSNLANTRLEINDVVTEIDATNKLKTQENNFWLWTLDKTYSLISAAEGIETTNEAMRTLRRTQMYLSLNGDASYTDTALGQNINDWKPLILFPASKILNGDVIYFDGLLLPPMYRDNQEDEQNKVLEGIEDIWTLNATNGNF